MTNKIKLTEELQWKGLRENFFIGTIVLEGKPVFIDKLSEAVADGTIDKLVAECAAKYHNNDTRAVLLAMSRILSSWNTNSKKRGYIPNSDIEYRRYGIMKQYVASKLAATATNTGKAYWQWPLEDIESCNDLRTIKSVYDNMASKKAKYPDDVNGDESFTERYKAAAAKYSELKRQAKGPAVPAALLSKLEKGSKATFTAEEAAELAKLLKSLSK